MIHTKPDGEIEVAMSGCFCCPPNARRPGLHMNAISHWWRVRGGEWQNLGLIAYLEALTLAEAAENCREFEKAILALQAR